MEHVVTTIEDLPTIVESGAGVFDKPAVEMGMLGTAPTEAGSACDSITTSSGVIEELANTLRSLQSKFGGEQWQGAYSDTFISDLGTLAADVDALKESATSIANWISSSSSGYTGIDTHFAGN